MGGGVGLAYLLEQGVSFDTWRKSGSLVADTFGEGSKTFFEGSGLSDARSLFHGGCLLLTRPNRRVQQATILVRVHSAFRALVNTTCSNHGRSPNRTANMEAPLQKPSSRDWQPKRWCLTGLWRSRLETNP